MSQRPVQGSDPGLLLVIPLKLCKAHQMPLFVVQKIKCALHIELKQFKNVNQDFGDLDITV
jgi:hypothetical protein